MPAQRTILEVRTAKDSEYTPEASAQFLSGLNNILSDNFFQRLLNNQPTISLEIASLNQRVFFIVTAPQKHQQLLRNQIAAQYPTSVITQMEDYLPGWTNYGHTCTGQLQLTSPYHFPLKTYNQFEDTDPLSAILGVLSKTTPHSAAIIQILLTAAPSGWAQGSRHIIEKGVSPDPEVFKAHPQANLIEDKISSPAYQADLRILTTSKDPNQAQSLLIQLSSAYHTYTLNQGNSFSLQKPKRKQKFISSLINRTPNFIPKNQVLNVVELASLFHFPSLQHVGIRNLAWGKTLRGEPPDNLPVAKSTTSQEEKSLTIYAKTEFKNRLAPFGIRLTDRRRHFYILGKSGTGKSWLMANMAISDLQKDQGLAVIDPHGDLSDILLDFVPDHRIKDVAYLDPTNMDRPFHLNPLEVKRPEHKELVMEGIVSIFHKLFHYSWGPRMEYIFRNTLLTLVETPGSTLLDVPKILTNGQFRSKIVNSLDAIEHQVLIDFWEKEFNQYSERLQTEAVAPILNKVGQFIGSPTIRKVLESPTSTIDLEEIMDQGKILILNVSQGKLGEANAALLGAMFITQFQLAAMNRVNVPEEERKDFFLYVDEFQNFATQSFIKILSEARKYRLGLTLANQYTAQLPEEIQKAIFGNVGTIATFVVGADDADRIKQEFGDLYTQDDLVNLGRYQIINKLTIDGRISSPFPAYTLPLPEQNRTHNRQKVITSSKQRHSQTKQEPSQNQPQSPQILPQQPLQTQPKVGETYIGSVTNIKDYGIFVEFLPDTKGLVHISNISKEYVKDPHQWAHKGDQIKVKLYEIDDQGRYNLTMMVDKKESTKTGSDDLQT